MRSAATTPPPASPASTSTSTSSRCTPSPASSRRFAGIILTARTGSGQPTSGSEGLELQSITAAALGGCALKGGKGGIGGTLLAVVLLGALNNGLNVVGVNTFWQNVAQGALLVVAVIIQQRRSGERAVGLPTWPSRLWARTG